jgi:CheY-like chemotaxis protein
MRHAIASGAPCDDRHSAIALAVNAPGTVKFCKSSAWPDGIAIVIEHQRRHGAGPRVLVVDDDADIATSIADVLRAAGYDVCMATDGAGALGEAEVGRVHMVLLDWRLPAGPSGAPLVRKLRDLCGAGLPVVVLSADRMSLAEAREAQVTDYLPKPFEVADLLDLVDQYCPT